MATFLETGICRGDIFYVHEGAYVGSEQRAGRPAVIVSNDMGNKHSANVEVVYLTSQTKKPLPTHVEIFCKTHSTALCENITTISKERLGDYMCSCTPSDMKLIDEALCISLGIDTVGANEAETPMTVATNIEVERDMYKTLYEKLLDGVLSRTYQPPAVVN